MRSLIARVKKNGQAVKKGGIQFRSNGSEKQVTLEVIPISSSSREPYYLILFRDNGRGKNNGEQEPGSSKVKAQYSKDAVIAKLEKELDQAREQMKSVSEEFEGTREELRSSNESL